MQLNFLNENGVFTLENPESVSALYLPLASTKGLKCAVTPNQGGDIKLDQETFLLEPVSVENLHNNRSTRNFWCVTEDGCWSATGASAEQEAARFTNDQDRSGITAGFMWQTVRRNSNKYGLSSEIISFVPYNDNVEIMSVRIANHGSAVKTIKGVAAIPIYGRSADNLRDHRDVTAMLHRIRTIESGVVVKPTLSFDEKGHRVNQRSYFVLGAMENGTLPVGFFPTVEAFIGEGGSFTHPRAVYENKDGCAAGMAISGKEAMGGIVFPPVTLAPGECVDYTLILGICDDEAAIPEALKRYGAAENAARALRETELYWQEKVNVRYHTGDAAFDSFMRWVSFQPFLRRIFGCSYLPHHDYGRGGRGWRDLWQDCLSLLLMDPGDVRQMIVANFGGVRIDGTNATIIGAGLGNFIADRNGIARVWMDHALWPLMTVRLYVDQTGDLDVLDETSPYFKDAQSMRGNAMDALWQPQEGTRQKTVDGAEYAGSLLEHLLVEHLSAFYEVGEHNILRLRGADWNDALDMAPERGESVAFSCAYAGNLLDLAALLRQLAAHSGNDERMMLAELEMLMSRDTALFESIEGKNERLNAYAARCAHAVSGKKAYSLTALAEDLEAKANWMTDHLRAQEWLNEGWFNSYYDNHGRRVEGSFPNGVRMMLTGQVFAAMSGVADDAQLRIITQSADKFLYDKAQGGYRLNTDFGELKLDMGRMFGFAYGEKENGAVFSHMAVMYANALYRRGLAREGYKALQSLADAALDFDMSRIYPGIPEYFSADGRGRYHYLTGAASWYMLTLITEVYGVRGCLGDLVIAPKLLRAQFDASGRAAIDLTFAGKRLSIACLNPSGKDFGEYRVQCAVLRYADANDTSLPVVDGHVQIPRTLLCALPDTDIQITVTLA